MKEGWTYKKLGEVCEIYNGNSINAEYKKQHFYGATGGLPFIATKDVSTIGTVDYNNGVRIPNYEDYKVAPANSVFICAEGGSAGKKFAFVEQDVCFGNKLFCINPKINTLLGKYIYHFIQSNIFKKQFYAQLTGLIGGVSAKKFQSIDIPLPPLSEQQQIVSRLDAAFAQIDALKANAEKQLSEARILFQKALEEAMKPKEDWEKKTLGEVCTKSRNIRWEDYQSDETFTYIDLTSVARESLSIIDPQIIDKNSAPSRAKQIIKTGDVIFATTRPTLRRVCLIVEKYNNQICSTGFCVLRPKEQIVSKWIFYSLLNERFYKFIEPLQTGASYPAVTDSIVKNYNIYFPSSIFNQQQIVSHLDSLNAKVREFEEVQRKTIAECDALKQAMLREVFE